MSPDFPQISRMTTERFRLRLLPLSIALIIVGTMVPIELRGPMNWGRGFVLMDYVNNLLLYAPLGIALCRKRLCIVAAIAFLLSAAAEILQIWEFQRFPSFHDVIANVSGAVIAAEMWRVLLHGHAPT